MVAWHLPGPGGCCSRNEFACRLVGVAVGLRCILVPPAALDVAADPRACGDGERACLDVAAERARLEQLHSRGRFGVAVQLTGHPHLFGLVAAAALGPLLDGPVASPVDVPLDLHGPATVAGAFITP